MITELGFSSKEAHAALERCNGHVERAIDFLLNLSPDQRAQLITMPAPSTTTEPTGADDEEEWEDEESSEEDEDPVKMVLCVRTDLGMSTGKMCAQCAHAAVDLVDISRRKPAWEEWLHRWEHRGACAKIVLQISSMEEATALRDAAASRDLPVTLIRDAGRTEVASGTTTVLGVGPAPSSLVNQVTGKLRLLK